MDAADILTGILLVAGVTLPFAFGAAWYNSRLRVRELEAQLRGADLPADARVEALERTVDALTEQLEQLASGQEFLGRLLATQRGHLPSESASPQVNTPH